MENLEAALDHAEAARKVTPEGGPARTLRLKHLAICFSHPHERTKNSLDREFAIDAWFAVWSVRTAPILWRIRPGHEPSRHELSARATSPSRLESGAGKSRASARA